MTPTRLTLNLDAGKARADRDRLLRLIFAIEDGLADGTATAHWEKLLRVAHWIAERDEEVPNGTR
jgi:hypothetical protein